MKVKFKKDILKTQKDLSPLAIEVINRCEGKEIIIDAIRINGSTLAWKPEHFDFVEEKKAPAKKK